MLNKQQHIDFWVRQAEDDWGAVEVLMETDKYSQALFWAHLVTEKYAKAVWIKHNNENIPPKTHNIAFLISKAGIEVPLTMMEIMLVANKFNLEGRYPEYINGLDDTIDKDFAADTINSIKRLIEWLKQHLQ